jgi:hypothetical protein
MYYFQYDQHFTYTQHSTHPTNTHSNLLCYKKVSTLRNLSSPIEVSVFIVVSLFLRSHDGSELAAAVLGAAELLLPVLAPRAPMEELAVPMARL